MYKFKLIKYFPDFVGFLAPYYFGPPLNLTSGMVRSVLLADPLRGNTVVSQWAKYSGVFPVSVGSTQEFMPALWQLTCHNYPTKRYRKLCLHVEQHPEFWQNVTVCYRQLDRQVNSD